MMFSFPQVLLDGVTLIPLLATWQIESELILFAVLIGGLLLGQMKVKGFQLGSAGIIFCGLLAGHFGFQLPAGVGTVGMIVFVYCLGIGAGPGFFRTLSRHGLSLAVLGVTMILSAGASVWAFAKLTRIPADLATGLFAGALTSTPALATVSEFLPPDSQLTVGFGIAYPFGTLLVILFVQIYPKFRQQRPGSPVTLSSTESPGETTGDHSLIDRCFVEVVNPAVAGKQLHDLPLLESANCQVSRVLRDGSYRPIPANFLLEVGQQLLIVGERHDLNAIVDLFGRRADSVNGPAISIDELNRRRVVITAPEVIGKSLKQLHLRSRFGVTISRIRRHDVEFVPDGSTDFHRGDAVTAVGEPAAIEQFMKFAGHRERSYHETDLASLSLGIALGLLLGMVNFQFAGGGFSLGKAGGPLIIGLLLGHFGRIGPVTGHFPSAARLLLTEFGLALFLADSGVRAGQDFVAVLTLHGPILLLGGVVITLVPLIVGALVGDYFLKLSEQPLLGGICGSMTSTPGLGALMSGEQANVAVRSYASIYPLALMLMSLTAPLLLFVLQQI